MVVELVVDRVTIRVIEINSCWQLPASKTGWLPYLALFYRFGLGIATEDGGAGVIKSGWNLLPIRLDPAKRVGKSP
jgi:hypothetical protein